MKREKKILFIDLFYQNYLQYLKLYLNRDIIDSGLDVKHEHFWDQNGPNWVKEESRISFVGDRHLFNFFGELNEFL